MIFVAHADRAEDLASCRRRGRAWHSMITRTLAAVSSLELITRTL